MAWDDGTVWALRNHSPTSQTFWVRYKAGGQLGVKIDGGSNVTGDTVSGTTDFTGLVTATGLSAGSHTYQLTVGGVDIPGATGSFTTAPDEGEPVTLIFANDWQRADFAAAAMMRETAHAMFCTEWLYIDVNEFNAAPHSATGITALRTSYNENGATGADPTADAAFLLSYRIKHRASLSKWRQRLMRKFQMYFMWDNHEFNSLATASAPGQSQFDAAYQAAREYMFSGNPANVDSDLDTAPSPVAYFRKTLGDIEIIVPDQQSYSIDAIDKTMNAAGRGDQLQVDWVIDRIAASTAKVVILCSPNTPNPITGAAAADWGNLAAGKIMTALSNKAATATVVLVTGDIHRPFARLVNASGYTANAYWEVGASPIKADSVSSYRTELTTGGVAYDDNTETQHGAIFSKAERDAANWKYLKIEYTPGSPGSLQMELRQTFTGAAAWSTTVSVP